MFQAQDRLARIALGFAAFFVSGSAAYAEAQTPTISGNAWVAIAIIVGLVALIALFISGALGISRRDKSDEDEAGVGILDGIDEDDDRPKKRK